MTIGITGATGQLGSLAIAALQRRAPDAELVALTRTPDSVEGVAARKIDYHEPETMRAAFDGIDVLVLISSNDFNERPRQHRNAIEAAVAAGVSRIVYTSILKGPASPLILGADHAATEADLDAAGIEATVLRNGWYTENYTGSLGAALEHGAVIGAAGTGRLSTAARADYAEAIAVVAGEDGHAGAVYELAGDGSFTLADYAAEVSRQAGREIPYVDMERDAYVAALTEAGLPEGFAVAVADADHHARDGWLFDESGTLSRLIGRPTTPLSESVAAAM